MGVVKKLILAVSIAVLAFSLAFLVDAIIANRFSSAGLCYIAKNSSLERKVHVLEDKDIFKYNVFGLYINKHKSIKAKKKIRVVSSEKFNGRLLGLIVGKSVAYAVFKIKDNITIVDNKSSGPIKIKSIDPYSVTVVVNGKEYKLAIEKSKNAQNIAASIRTSSNGYIKVRLSKSFAEKSISDINNLMRSVAVYPFYQGGRFVGYRIGSVAYGSLLWKIGLRNGDIITRINGERLDNPQQLLALFSNISNLSAVTVDFYRGGKKKTLLVELY